MDEGDVFLDADIAILGTPPEIYDQYAANMRFEYAFAPDDAYRMGRSHFLSNAMTRAPIFRTAEFEAAYGDAARANMRREFERLQGG
jgi:predicted metal-dependent HD superfamily phosphohydrolase